MNLLKFSFLFFLLFSIGTSVAVTKNKSTKDPDPQELLSRKPTKMLTNLNDYSSSLMELKKTMNQGNYKTIVYEKVCPYMEALKTFDSKDKINQKKRKQFLEEVVKIYGKVFDFPFEYSVMYCVYNYYKSPNPPEILEIVKKLLPEKKQKEFTGLLKVCDQEEREGNGDNPKNVPYEQTSRSQTPSLLLSSQNYQSLSASDRLSYIKKLKMYYLQFELDVQKELSLQLGRINSLLLFDFLISQAVASFKGKCLIGGVVRKTYYSKRLKRRICSVWRRQCDGRSDTFQCGQIFGNECININPTRSISNRCYEASKNKAMSPKDYADYKSEIENILKQYCIGRRKQYASCQHFIKKAETLEQSMVAGATSPFPSTLDPTNAKTEGKGTCLDCAKNQAFNQTANQIKAIQTSVKGPSVAEMGKKMREYVSKNIVDNSLCKCQGNNICTKGCKKRQNMEKGESYPPILKCLGEKNQVSSTGKCARHVTGTIMSTIHKFLAKYCTDKLDDSNKRVRFNQCVKEANAGKNFSKRNICHHALIFPSAICTLNLDGKSDNLFSTIKNKSVRKGCKNWSQYNERLVSIPVKQDDGSVKNVSLFKKMDLNTKQLQEFQNNPSRIPSGAFVVLNSLSIHGHIEVKTGKNICGKNKDQVCFCSDYCMERKDYNPQYKLRTVFEWNPELIKYIAENY